QDKFTLQNELGPDARVLHKIIQLTGNRPCFIDKVQQTSLDSAHLITVWLKPQAAAQATSSSPPLAGSGGAGARPAAPPVLASRNEANFGASATNDKNSPGDARSAKVGPSGGNLQIQQPPALGDAHWIAPARTMTARERLDAEFVELEPPGVTTTPPPASGAASNAPAANQDEPPAPEQGQDQDQAADQ